MSVANERIVCTKERPSQIAVTHTMTPKSTNSTYCIDHVRGIYQVHTEYKCIYCGLEITAIQEASL
jgi:hypothetical protein